MARQTRKTKPLIYVFCEGESEQAYAQYLKERFESVAVIKWVPQPGFFEEAQRKFKRDAHYRNSIDVTDEIWFFFDVEKRDSGKWNQNLEIIRQLRKLRKKPGIRIRLLMTTSCIEYWLLHYEMTSPPICTVADKERILKRLLDYAPDYAKGNEEAIAKIAQHYKTAIQNGSRILDALLNSGMPAERIATSETAGCTRARKPLPRYMKRSGFWRS